MQIFRDLDPYMLAAKALGRPCLYLSVSATNNAEQDVANVKRDAPWLTEPVDLVFGALLIALDTDEERDQLFSMTSGDDTGGTVYALTISKDGLSQNENT
jgi:hypothetical protein